MFLCDTVAEFVHYLISDHDYSIICTYAPLFVLISIILVTMCEVYFYSMTINAVYLSYYCTSPHSMRMYVPTYV